MTQEQKELLLKDLSARLPYGVKCKLIYNNKAIKDEDATLFGIDKYGSFLFAEFGEDTRKFVCKPYLFPLSSMTEKQEYQYREVIASSLNHYEVYDWLNRNHFDYRGLIEKGLAIDATRQNVY